MVSVSYLICVPIMGPAGLGRLPYFYAVPLRIEDIEHPCIPWMLPKLRRSHANFFRMFSHGFNIIYFKGYGYALAPAALDGGSFFVCSGTCSVIDPKEHGIHRVFQHRYARAQVAQTPQKARCLYLKPIRCSVLIRSPCFIFSATVCKTRTITFIPSCSL